MVRDRRRHLGDRPLGFDPHAPFGNVFTAAVISWIVGFLLVPVPGGVGVGEGAFTALVSLPKGIRGNLQPFSPGFRVHARRCAGGAIADTDPAARPQCRAGGCGARPAEPLETGRRSRRAPRPRATARPVEDRVVIDGVVDSGYERVRDAFARNFDERDEVGAAVCVYVDGRPVVDLWGGVADATTGCIVKRDDTVVLVYSSTKGVTSVCANLLVEARPARPRRRRGREPVA